MLGNTAVLPTAPAVLAVCLWLPQLVQDFGLLAPSHYEPTELSKTRVALRFAQDIDIYRRYSVCPRDVHHETLTLPFLSRLEWLQVGSSWMHQLPLRSCAWLVLTS